MKLKPNQVKRSCKRSPIGPTQAIQVLQAKMKHQNAAFRKQENGAENKHHRQPMVFTMACGGGRTVVLLGTHDRASPLLPGCFSFLRRYSFPCAVFQSVLCFALKKEDVSGLFGVQNSSLSPSQTPLKKKKAEEEGLGKRRRVGGKSKDRHSSMA